MRLAPSSGPDGANILELAVNGEANVIVTGDDDLLSLHLFRGIDILPPAAYLERRPTISGIARTRGVRHALIRNSRLVRHTGLCWPWPSCRSPELCSAGRRNNTALEEAPWSASPDGPVDSN